MKSIRSLGLAILVSAFAANAAMAAIDVRIDAEIRIGKAPPPPPPEVVVVERVGPEGPPPWAPAHGRRGKAYYFYPEADVYYRPADHMWFYLDGGDWRVGARLPDTIRIDFGRSVALTLEGERPYDHHKQVVSYYPRNYFTKVKIKGGHDSRGDKRHDDEGGHGKGKDKGKGKNKGR